MFKKERALGAKESKIGKLMELTVVAVVEVADGCVLMMGVVGSFILVLCCETPVQVEA